MNDEQKNFLQDLYTDPSKVGSFGGVQQFLRGVRREGRFDISRKDVRDWLLSSEVYTLHKPLKRKFERNRVVVGGLNIEWDVDLADMSLLQNENNNFRYFIVAIDDFSKFVYTKALKTKTGREVTEAFRGFIDSSQNPPMIVRTDKGTEFLSRVFTNLLKSYKIRHWITQNELKANIAERCIKTLKNKLYKYFTHSQTLKWFEILPAITSTYNSSFHRSIKDAPANVTLENEDEIYKTLYPEPFLEKPTKFKLEINDKVRLSTTRKPFEREYDIKYTVEFFLVMERFYKESLPKYRLKDYGNEPILGSFYEEELQKIYTDDNTVYRIETVLRRRVRNRVPEVLVKWYGWPDKFNSFIPASDLQDYGYRG